jgi:hypothetical protein
MKTRIWITLLVSVICFSVVNAGGWNLKKGEIGLRGRVKSVNLKTRSMVIMANVCVLPPHENETKWTPSRRYVIHTTKNTVFTGAFKVLEKVKPGYMVAVGGKNQGRSKNITVRSAHFYSQ